MRLKAWFVVLLALATAAAWLAAYSRSQPLVVAVHPWIGYESLSLAQELGWLPHEVALRHGHSTADSMAALQAGTVDAATLTLDEVLLLRAAGTPLTVVLIMDSSNGADELLTRPQITTLAALAGKRIGYEPTAVGALVLSEVLARAGLASGDVTLIHLPPTGQLAAWNAGEVDAVITYAPTATLLKHAGATPLFDSRQMPDTIFDVLAIRRDRIAGRETALRALLKAHFMALDHLRHSRPDALHRIATRQRISPEDVEQALGGVTLPDLAGNRYALGPGSRFQSATQRLNELMVERGILANPDPLDHINSPAYLPTPDATSR